ncbi:MAG: single-stranded-DNA-specific exonuclease RecJ [Candidatus Moranbacteria bacterium]|nr:single-stranded-DNA-specific exonuclease RecJ [Candidatus Moranbacteria bacterium]
MSRAWKSRSVSDGDGYRSVDDVIGELLRLRGVDTDEDRKRFLSPDYDRDLHDPFLFSSMSTVMDRLRKAKDSGEHVGLFGDFDADGITSSILMSEGLAKLGIPFSVYLPDKHTEGHGLSMKAVKTFASEGVKLVITVDCGMMNHEEIAEAGRLGMETIVVDHHHAPETLPDALAFINPKIPGEPYPFKELCGAGVAFKVLQAVYKTYFPKETDQLKWLLDVVAVGTVADVMPLIDENRIIVAYGLIVLSKTRRPGFREMFATGRLPIREGKAPTARDISFHVAPRLNAASRMAHAQAAHDLLAAVDADRARELADILETHNVERQKVSADIAALARVIALERSDKNLVFAVHEDFHFGVVGLVAGKIANEFGKPTILLSKGETESKGSLRSVPGLNIIEVVEACADLLDRYGGHAQAAGLTLKNENLVALEERMDRLVAERLGTAVMEPELAYDLRLPTAHLSLDFARTIGRMAPFGEGNPEPVFLGENLVVSDSRPVGKTGTHLKLLLAAEDGREYDAIGFSLADRIPDLVRGERIDVLFQLDENEWNGRVNIQLKLVDMRRSV